MQDRLAERITITRSFGDTEIRDPRLAVLIDQDIGRFDIAVDHLVRVRVVSAKAILRRRLALCAAFEFASFEQFAGVVARQKMSWICLNRAADCRYQNKCQYGAHRFHNNGDFRIGYNSCHPAPKKMLINACETWTVRCSRAVNLLPLTMRLLLVLGLVAACSSSSSSSAVPVGLGIGADGDGGSKKLSELGAAEQKTLCDWTALAGGGYGKSTVCDGGVVANKRHRPSACRRFHAPAAQRSPIGKRVVSAK